MQDYGFLFIAIDPAIMLPDFEAQMAELVARIKATPRQPDVDEIRIPSERAFRERESAALRASCWTARWWMR